MIHLPSRSSVNTFTLVVTALVLVAPGFAGAQVLEEIVVTAQKREQNVQEVGIAITAYSGKQLTQMGMNESTDVAYMTPGVFVSGSSNGQTREFSIRGVTQNDFADFAENPNAIYVDEGYIGFRQAGVFATFDINRVEVLKGPQGTLFGRNATGGLVHYITNKPTEEREGYVDVTYGRENTVNVEGAISGALTDRINGRISGMYKRHDDILDNIFPFEQSTNPAEAFGGPTWFGSNTGAADLWNDDQWAVRGQLQFEINEDAEILISGYAAEQNVSSSPGQVRATTAVRIDSNGDGSFNETVNSIFAKDDPRGCEVINGTTGGCLPVVLTDGEFFGPGNPTFGPEDFTRPVVGGDFWGHIDPDGDDFDVSTDHVSNDYNRYRSQGVTAKLTWDFGNISLSSVSHYMHFDMRESIDTDGGPTAQGIVMRDTKAQNFAQELRLNGEFESARWVAGLYYLWIDVADRNGFANSAGGPLTTTLIPFVTGTPVGAIPPLEANNMVDLETNSFSVFGQLDVDLTDTLTFIAGLRTIFEFKDFSYTSDSYVNLDDLLVEFHTFGAPGFAPFAGSQDQTMWTGKLQMDWKPTDDLLIYAGVNRGVKAGSFNGPVNVGQPRLLDSQFPYDPEVLTAYEVGFKSTLFGGSTRFNGSFYYYDYDDYQAFLFVNNSGAIFNNDAKTKGIEFDVLTQPIDNFTFMFNASFIDAEITNLALAPGVFRDVEPAFTPSVQMAGMARYEWPNSLMGGTVAVQAEANSASHRYQNIRNFQAQKMDPFVMGDVRLFWTSADEHWEFTGFVENVADARVLFTGFDLSTLCGCTTDGYMKPRWWGIRLRYNYF